MVAAAEGKGFGEKTAELEIPAVVQPESVEKTPEEKTAEEVAAV